MNLKKRTHEDNQEIDPAYFLKLAAALIILAAVYFGTSFTKEKTPAKNQPIINQGQKNENVLAAGLPLAQQAFLLPLNEMVAPIRKWNIKEPEFSARAVYAIEINSRKTLIDKSSEETQPIASLSKLMTALIVAQRANLKDTIIISENAVNTYGEMGNLIANEEITIESLLYAMLIESSNDAAVALAEKFNGQFIDFMNEGASMLGLKKTFFADPSGLNPENISSAKDLERLTEEVMKYPILNEIMRTEEIDIHSADGKHSHHLINSNKLLAKYPQIVAGKTGYTEEAEQCMIVALESPNGQGIIINIVLGSQDRIGEMDKLIQWEIEGFIW